MNGEELGRFLLEVKKDADFRSEMAKLVREKGDKIEKDVERMLNEFCENKKYEFRFMFNGTNKFPDLLVVNRSNEPLGLGVEVKTSKKGEIPGNSIMETANIAYNNLYVLGIEYGENSFDIHVGRYFDFISSIKITHSPRYYLAFNTNLEKGLFGKMKRKQSSSETMSEFVEEMRKDKKKLIVNAYEVSGRDSFPDWVSSFPVEEDDSSSEEIQPLLNPYPNDDSDLKAKGFVWCPIIFSNSKKKNRWFEKRVLIEGYLPKTNIRDLFTASGQVEVRGVKCPHILSVFNDVNKEIIEYWKRIKRDTKLQSELQEFWNEQMNQGTHIKYSFPLLFDRWKEMCVTLFANYSTNKDKSSSGTSKCVGLLSEIIDEMKKKI